MVENQKQILEKRKDKGCIFKCCVNIIKSSAFVYFINIVIILNTITLAQDRYPIDTSSEAFMESLNLVFFAIFLLEMIVKMIGLGFKLYIKENFNIFDCIIVLISTVDILIYYTTS